MSERTCSCGRPIPAHTGAGRPRAYCYVCRPLRKAPKPARPCACGCGRTIPAGGKAKWATPACRARGHRQRNEGQKP